MTREKKDVETSFAMRIARVAACAPALSLAIIVLFVGPVLDVFAQDSVASWKSALTAAAPLRDVADNPAEASVQKPISTFRQVILLPPRGQGGLVDDLLISGAGVWPYFWTWDAATDNLVKDQRPYYQIELGRTQNGFPQARSRGWPGQERFTSAASPTACVDWSDPAYCASIGYMPNSGSETFLGFTVGLKSAVVQHAVRPINWPDQWLVVWYDGDADMTHQFELTGCFGNAACPVGPRADLFANRTLSPDNRQTAQQLVDFVSTFVPIQFAS